MKNKAFTLIELLVVITIIGILAAMVVPIVHKIRNIPYVSSEQQIANELKRANDLKEKELEINRLKLPAEQQKY